MRLALSGARTTAGTTVVGVLGDPVVHTSNGDVASDAVYSGKQAWLQ